MADGTERNDTSPEDFKELFTCRPLDPDFIRRAEENELTALAALVVSGHKAIDDKFIERSACAALTMIHSARSSGDFGGDAIVMTGPLGESSPHDLASWRRASKGWLAQHETHVAELAAILEDDMRRTRVLDLVPILLGDKYPFMRRNLNYMKLAVYTLNQYDKVVFMDLDIVVTRSLSGILALSTSAIELVGYRTCTAPVNSGFFVVRPQGSNGERRLRHLNDITMRNRCPCRSRQEPFASYGFDNQGAIAGNLKQLWDDGIYNAPNTSRRGRVCQNILNKRDKTWDLAGSGTGQGLMWYYYGLTLNSYVSLTYSDLPLVHYNSPGPKPWTAGGGGGARQFERQTCDFVWWNSFLTAETSLPTSTFHVCANVFMPRFTQERATRLAAPICCRACPGGGHFATARHCSEIDGLAYYAKNDCRVVAELRQDNV